MVVVIASRYNASFNYICHKCLSDKIVGNGFGAFSLGSEAIAALYLYTIVISDPI